MPNANNLPVHVQKTRSIGSVITAAITNAANDAPGNLVLLGTVGVNGGLLTRLWAIPRGSTSASSLNVYVKRADSAHYQQIDSLVLPLYTTNTASAKPVFEFTRYSLKNPLDLGAGDQVYAGCEIGQAGLDVNATLREF